MSRGWLALTAVLVVGALGGAAVPRALIDWQPALALSQPWRAWTAIGVHYSALHLGANLAGAVLVGALGAAARVGSGAVLAWAVAWPLTQAGLLLRPDLLHYGGLSGVLHAGVAVVAVHLVVAVKEPRPRWIGAATGAVLAAKVLLEAPWGPALRRVDGWDIALAPAAHASGALVGAAAGLVAALASMRRHD